MNIIKKCLQCGNEFSSPKGKNFCCEKCRQRYYYLINKEKRKEYKAEYYKNHKEEYDIRKTKWIEEHRQEWNDYYKQYREKTKEEIDNK